MDLRHRSLYRDSLNNPVAAEHLVAFTNRLMALGHLPTIRAYTEELRERRAPSIHNADVETGPWSPIPLRYCPISEANLQTLSDNYSWESDEFDQNKWDASLRNNAGELRHHDCQAYSYGPCYNKSRLDEVEDWCEGCRARQRHRRAVVRLILARRNEQPTIVSFDDTDPAHHAGIVPSVASCNAASGQFDVDFHYPVVKVWSEALGKPVYRDSVCANWNTDWTVEYHNWDIWYQDRVDYLEEREYERKTGGWSW